MKRLHVWMSLFFLLFNAGSSFAQQFIKPNCDSHNGAASVSISWDIATRKSGCTHGLGFRCGTHGIVRCYDGTMVTWRQDPTVSSLNFTRPGFAEPSFFYSKTGTSIKLAFLEKLPLEAEEDADIFYVDEDVIIENPSKLILDDKEIQYILIKAGSYKVNYLNDKYGSVVMNCEVKY